MILDDEDELSRAGIARPSLAEAVPSTAVRGLPAPPSPDAAAAPAALSAPSIAAPSTPAAGSTEDLEAKALAAHSAPRIAPPDAPAGPRGLRPQPGDFQPEKMPLWEKILSPLAIGAASYKNPGVGEKLMDEFYQAPKREAQQKYETASTAYEKQVEDELKANPKSGLTPEETTIHDLMTGENGQPRLNPQTNKPFSYLEAFQAVKQAGQDVKPDKETPPHVTYDNGIPVSVVDPHGKVYDVNDPQLPPELKSLAAAANRAHGSHLSEEADKQAKAEAKAAQRAEHSTDARAETDANKRYDTALDADQRLSRMESAYQKAVSGDQQAMLSLLADHLGMTLGMQKGARITKDILNEAQQSQPWLAKLAAKFDSRGYLSGVTLGSEQMRQMLELGYAARDRAVQGAYDASELYGVKPPKGAEKVFGKRKTGEMPALEPQGGAPAAGTVEGGYKFKGGNPADQKNWEKVPTQ
jgi:hypothetical protein